MQNLDSIIENFNDRETQNSFDYKDMKDNMAVAVIPYFFSFLFFCLWSYYLLLRCRIFLINFLISSNLCLNICNILYGCNLCSISLQKNGLESFNIGCNFLKKLFLSFKFKVASSYCTTAICC